VASFELDGELPPDLLRGVNAVAPDDLSVTAAERAPDSFDARRDARSRTYCYRLLTSPVPSPFERGRALWWPHRLDLGALESCAAALAGTHDFTAFTPTETDHVRFDREILRAEWVHQSAASSASRPGAAGDLLDFWIEADAFMRHMVRVLVGTMLEVGGGRRELEDFERLLDGAPRSAAGETVEPHGLYLASVTY
jgi:tRNA pseudouridine38-40 synthase